MSQQVKLRRKRLRYWKNKAHKRRKVKQEEEISLYDALTPGPWPTHKKVESHDISLIKHKIDKLGPGGISSDLAAFDLGSSSPGNSIDNFSALTVHAYE